MLNNLQKRAIGEVLTTLKNTDPFPIWMAINLALSDAGMDDAAKRPILKAYEEAVGKVIYPRLSSAKSWLETLLSDADQK